MEKLKNYPVNIWDDYNDNDPKGAYAYVENPRLPKEQTKIVLEKLKLVFDKLLLNTEVKTRIEFYDSKTKYPDLADLDTVNYFIQRWEIKFENLTHELRESLVNSYEKNPIYMDDILIRVYSES